MIPFFALYAWGIWCGVQMLESQPAATRSNLKFWAIQVPVLQSSIFFLPVRKRIASRDFLQFFALQGQWNGVDREPV